MNTKNNSIELGGDSHSNQTCATCNLRELCMPAGMPANELERLDTLVSMRRRVKRGNALFRIGDKFRSLYAVRTGFFKTCMHNSDGRTQVTGFQIPGDVLGLDSVSTDHHNVDALALADCDVCVIPYHAIERLSLHCPSLQQQLQRMMGSEIIKDHGVMMLLGQMRASERLAAFLLNMSERFKRLGYSSTEFNLRMTRDDIGSFLGLKIETVSRTFTKMQNDNIIDVRGKEIKLLDIPKLNAMLKPNC